MKWFKHQTNMKDSDGVRALMNQFGYHKGYACFNLLVETLTKDWDGKSDPMFREDERVLRQSLGVSSVFLQQFLNTCSEVVGLSFHIDSTKFGKFYQIAWPNLAEIRDEYSKKSGQTPDNVRRDSGADKSRIDKDKETEKEVRGKFDIINELSSISDPIVRMVLPKISTSTQETWARKYKNPEDVSRILREAIDWHTSTEQKHIHEIQDFGRKLVVWLRRQPHFDKNRPPDTGDTLSDALKKKREEIEAKRKQLEVIK